MSEELKPCPFCGPGTHLKIYRHGPDEPDCFVQCDTCTTCGPTAQTPEQAAAAWNRRAAPTSPVSEAEELPALPETGWAHPNDATRRALYAADQMHAYGQECARAASTRTASDTRTVDPDFPAIERAAEYLEHYAAYLQEVKLEDIERHPYIPSIQEAAEELRAMSAGAQIAEGE